MMKRVVVNAGDLTLAASGFCSISNLIPEDQGTFVFAALWDVDSVSSKSPIFCNANGRYLMGEGGATAVNVKIAYFYK